MKIAFLAGNLYPLLADRDDLGIVGGAEIQQLLLARELRRQGMEVVFISEDFGQGPEAEAGGFMVFSYRFGRDKTRQAWTLWRALRRAAADLYYVRGAPRFVTLLDAYCRLHRRPYVLGLCTNYMVYPRKVTGQAWPDHLVYRLALRGAAAVVAQSDFQAGRLREHFGVRDPVVIRNGAELTPPSDAPIENRVVWIATLHRYKGVEAVFELAERLPQLSFEIIGGPSRTDEGYYREAEVRGRGIANVIWRGMLPHDQIDGALRGALAFVNTTRPALGVPNLEGFPNVYLEAWRRGIPTLTLDNDPDELICRFGLGFHCHTVERMGEDLARLAGDPEERRRMGAAARGHFEREHDISRLALRYRRVFEEAVG